MRKSKLRYLKTLSCRGYHKNTERTGRNSEIIRQQVSFEQLSHMNSICEKPGQIPQETGAVSKETRQCPQETSACVSSAEMETSCVFGV